MITLAIVGCGAWGETLVRSVQGKSANVRFGAVVSRSVRRVAAIANELGLVVHTSLDDALADGAIDGIVLATPHSQHAAQISACIEAGRPVFVEKPFTLDHASAAALLRDAPGDLVIAAGHNRRFLPAVKALKQMIAVGQLGRIMHIECNFSGNVVKRYHRDLWRVAPDESPAGGMAGMGIHMLDLIIHLVAPIREVVAMSRRQVLELPMDDTTYALFALEGGAGAVLSTTTASAPAFRLQVFGSEGAAELRGRDRLELTDLSGELTVRTFPPFDIERAELEAFADAILGRAPYPVSRSEILNGIAAFEAVAASAETDRKIVLGGGETNAEIPPGAIRD